VSCCGHRPAASFLSWCAGEVGGTATARKGPGQCRLNTSDADARAGLQTIMSIAGHVSRAMLSRYSNVWTEAKRRALDANRRTPERGCREAGRGSRAERTGCAGVPMCGNPLTVNVVGDSIHQAEASAGIVLNH
jgi:hypothetical protein